MTRLTPLALLLVALAAPAEDIKYVSDIQYVPLRSGQGSEYRIIHRGIPSGTPLTVHEENPDSGYSRVTTPNGLEGWILTRYLMAEEPARDRLAAMIEREKLLSADEDSLRARYQALEAQNQALQDNLASMEATLAETREELNEVRRVSGSALALDDTNRRLAEEAEVLRTERELLEAENLRLKDSRENQAFMNGAFAVVIGVLITLIVPRLWPRRRSSSSWT